MSHLRAPVNGYLDRMGKRRMFRVYPFTWLGVAKRSTAKQKKAVSPTLSPTWIRLEDGNVRSLVEAAYRFAAHTEPVTAVMCGTLEPAELEENVQALKKGPLAQETVERLRATFGHLAEPIGN